MATSRIFPPPPHLPPKSPLNPPAAIPLKEGKCIHIFGFLALPLGVLRQENFRELLEDHCGGDPRRFCAKNFLRDFLHFQSIFLSTCTGLSE